jgi:hypothetical protein
MCDDVQVVDHAALSPEQVVLTSISSPRRSIMGKRLRLGGGRAEQGGDGGQDGLALQGRADGNPKAVGEP